MWLWPPTGAASRRWTTSVRECSHLKHEISINVAACVLSILRVGGKFPCTLQKEKWGALLLCNRGPLGTLRGRWSCPQCITCILNLVCCVLHGGSGARPALALLACSVIVGTLAVKPGPNGTLIIAHDDVVPTNADTVQTLAQPTPPPIPPSA